MKVTFGREDGVSRVGDIDLLASRAMKYVITKIK